MNLRSSGRHQDIDMKILYIILTCRKYAETRQRWQRETWLKNVDYVYLDDDKGGYKEAPLKYVEYLRNKELKHDWYFFCDDDTFVYTEKLNAVLEWQMILEPTIIGFKGGEFKIYNLSIPWCSGGAGVAVNKSCAKSIQKHLRDTRCPIITDETDISLAIWAKMSCNAAVIDNKRFSPFKPSETPHTMKDCISYHYCDEMDFKRLNERI